jgi:hypothetical protein
VSGKLIPLYRAMADTKAQFFGLSVLENANTIGALLRKHKAQSIIDWGCGRGDAYKAPHKVWKQWGLSHSAFYLHDPSFPRYALEPAHVADAVICNDVLEHVPEAEVDEFVGKLFAHANLFVWASFCNRPAKKFFPGTDVNLHCTLHDMAWWTEKFAALSGGKTFYLTESK